MKRFLKILQMMLLLPIFPALAISDFSDDEYIDEPEEEIEDIDEPEEEDDEEIEEPDEEPIDEEEPEQEKIDKKTHAIIKAKQKAKAISDENKALKAELARIKAEEEKKQESNRRKEIEDQYIEDGWNEDAAKKMAQTEARLEKMERRQIREQYERKAEKLESEYPDIIDNLERLIDLCEKTGWSLSKVAAAELDKTTEYDRKIRTEQSNALKQDKQKNKPINNNSKLTSVKLSPDDEAAYKYYASKNPGVSRKQYKEKVLDPRKNRE